MEEIELKLEQNKKYLDNIFQNIKLDKEQRIAILTDEKYLILIAGAGSGKTTTLSAKVKYLKEKLNIKPEEILIISFTNKAVEELKKKINDQFKIKAYITTFHKLGLDIIKQKYKNIKIINNDSIINNYINNKLKNKKIKNKIKKNSKNILIKTIILNLIYFVLLF